MADRGQSVQLSVVIPAFRAASILGRRLPVLLDHLDGLPWSWEVVVVDDGSPDATASVARALLGDRGRVLVHPVNRGKGAAVRTGLLAARGAVRLFTDADIPYSLDAVERGAQVLLDGSCDLLAGNRYLLRGPGTERRARQVASQGYRLLTRLLFRFSNGDTQCGFKGLTASAAERLVPRLKTDGFAFDVELLARSRQEGLRVQEIAVSLVEDGESTVEFLRHGPRMLGDLARIRLDLWLSGP